MDGNNFMDTHTAAVIRDLMDTHEQANDAVDTHTCTWMDMVSL